MTYLTATLSGPQGADRIRKLARASRFTASLPVKMTIGSERVVVTTDWVEKLASAQLEARAWWEPSELQLGLRPRSDELVVLSIPCEGINIRTALDYVESLPFEVCAFGSVFFDEWINADLDRWAFSRGHIDHGWGCVFRGAGHDRLMSRRWLDFGPWRVIRRPDDTTVVQFHDLSITDPEEAYEQAKVGHERMGVSDTGGFIQQLHDDMFDRVKGIYFAEDHRLEIVIAPGIEVTQYEMKCAAALRLHGKLNPQGRGNPVEKIAYVFLDEAQARAHLHELWLRELECWVVDDKGKRRLDDEYRPIPEPPAWVQRLGAEI